MIEFPITLTSGGSVCLPGHAFALALGYTKNRGVYRLAVTATGEWEGLTIRAFWHVPDGKDPASSLVVDGYVDVPASVTAQPGSGCITFEGSDGTKTVTSADLHYRVSANSGTEDGTEPEPGTPAWQQLVDAVHTDAAAAEQAKTDAQTAASESATSAGNADQSAQEAADSLQELKDGIASGDFKGEPGTSPTVAVQDIAGGHRIIITDATGTSFVDVLNGKQGDPGKPGDVGATPELTIGTVKEGDAPSATITGTAKNPVLNLTLKSGAPGKDATVDTTLTHEGEAADAKATGDAISAVKARQNILVGTDTGNPIAVDDAFTAPMCGLTVYGRSTQDGTPTPDNPVPIVSAGDGGSVAVKVTGKNLLDFLHDKITKAGWIGNFTRDEEILTVSTVNGWNAYWFVSPVPGKQISVSFTYRQIDDKTGDSSQALSVGTSESPSYMSNDVYHVNSPEKSWTKITCNMISEAYIGVMIRVGNEGVNEERTIEIKDFQLELGSTATAYSPYREQLLTLSTPNGLPGIPVASGGSYTDPQGQQWVCDEVDLERGVKVQNVKTIVFSDNSGFAREVTDNGIRFNREAKDLKITDATTADSGAFCSALTLGRPGGTWLTANVFTINVRLYVRFENITSLDELQQYLQQTPMTLTALLATPIEKPLTPAEIAAYKALTAYGPDTVVQAGDGAGVKLGYQRDVNIAIKRIEDAVASMT